MTRNIRKTFKCWGREGEGRYLDICLDCLFTVSVHQGVSMLHVANMTDIPHQWYMFLASDRLVIKVDVPHQRGSICCTRYHSGLSWHRGKWYLGQCISTLTLHMQDYSTSITTLALQMQYSINIVNGKFEFDATLCRGGAAGLQEYTGGCFCVGAWQGSAAFGTGQGLSPWSQHATCLHHSGNTAPNAKMLLQKPQICILFCVVHVI